MKRWLAFGAFNGALAVAAGAFAAHSLKTRLSPDMLAVFETGARYHLIHALAVVAAALAAEHFAPRPAKAAVVLFTGGILLFSGSLYLLALTGPHGFGFVTPFGGMAFIAGWLALAWSGLRQEG
jgi:uncharacterized membrane protein YgdD (TMEM256/DUF423 family)